MQHCSLAKIFFPIRRKSWFRVCPDSASHGCPPSQKPFRLGITSTCSECEYKSHCPAVLFYVLSLSLSCHNTKVIQTGQWGCGHLWDKDSKMPHHSCEYRVLFPHKPPRCNTATSQKNWGGWSKLLSKVKHSGQKFINWAVVALLDCSLKLWGTLWSPNQFV